MVALTAAEPLSDAFLLLLLQLLLLLLLLLRNERRWCDNSIFATGQPQRCLAAIAMFALQTYSLPAAIFEASILTGAMLALASLKQPQVVAKLSCQADHDGGGDDDDMWPAQRWPSWSSS